jgi:NAD(P)-dependent dehydrogenase (short-subunit alcohol dehydrogenase family)
VLEGKTCIITGANSGIGRETALGLANMRATIVMVCRSIAKGEAVQREIVKTTGNSSIETMQCDLSSLAEVRRLAAEVIDKHARVHVLVNNAGLFSLSGRRTVDGFETTFAVNYLAPFLLTNLLLDLLKKSAPSRIVNVSSASHYGGHVDLDAIKRSRGGSGGLGAYSNSKLALVMFTHELARRLHGTGVTANCLHPGTVATGISRFPTPLLRLFMKSPREGAETSIFLASSPEVETVSGEYFDNKAVKRSAEESYDENNSIALWELTSKLVGLSA